MHLERHLGHLWNHPAGKETIGSNRQVFVRQHVLQLQPVNHQEDPFQQWFRDLETYEVVVLLRRIAILCDLQGVESELRLQMRRGVLGIANGVAIFRAQLRIMERDRLVDRRVAIDVRDIVRERAQRKGIFVGILAFSHQLQNKVPGADVMGQVAEVLVAEWVITQILNDRAAIGIGVRLPKLVFGKFRKALQQEGPDLARPH